MSASVFFKFKSQKEPSRVTFDGTGISVFELKREIIVQNRLGDGTDFDLVIANQDTNEEYDDDTTIIPRNTYIIARRLPAIKQGRGTAARYVSGRMPTAALPNAGRVEKSFAAQKNAMNNRQDNFGNRNQSQQNGPHQGGGGGDSEEDKIAQMFQQSNEQWQQTQERMATATPVYRGGPNQGGFKKNAPPVPSHPPPTGYICYRCGEKGHWIQACPTNSDPNYDGRPRVKRTTGIPRSFLKTVEKPLPPTANSGLDGQTSLPQQPSAVMVNADGQFVIAEPDKASWDTYQLKASKSAAKVQRDKELEERGIECSHCQKLYKDAVKTPCCEKTFCEECIQHQLLESDFICPICETKDVLLDQLVPDMEVRKKVDDYLVEKKAREAKEPPRPQNAPQQNFNRGPMPQQQRFGPGPQMMNRPMMNGPQRPMPMQQPRTMVQPQRPAAPVVQNSQPKPASAPVVANNGAPAPTRVATPPQAPTVPATESTVAASTEGTATAGAKADDTTKTDGEATEKKEGTESTDSPAPASTAGDNSTSKPTAADGTGAPTTPPAAPASTGTSTPPAAGSTSAQTNAPSGSSGSAPVNPRKRPADDIPNAPRAPSAMRNQPPNQAHNNQHRPNMHHPNQMHNNFQQNQFRPPMGNMQQFPYFNQMGYPMPQQPFFPGMPMPPFNGMGYGAPNPNMMFNNPAMFMPPMFNGFPNQMGMPVGNAGGFNNGAAGTGMMPMNQAGGPGVANQQRPVKRVRQDDYTGMGQ
ncbi:DWNN-domain-containing protein [Ascobolus immersus RN42]|uniref:DWNN-domain-containing protein n=1 Tax=Ascobolus immersus RN42 TaxID=1160509 RepID=A0A3N4I8I2_ASCIM|nr:DWNN-domain-containing protein [Ascobolus immersus RN42]